MPTTPHDPTTLLRPIETGRSLAENAADRIREQVLIGGYRQGQHLVEARIADQTSSEPSIAAVMRSLPISRWR